MVFDVFGDGFVVAAAIVVAVGRLVVVGRSAPVSLFRLGEEEEKNVVVFVCSL